MEQNLVKKIGYRPKNIKEGEMVMLAVKYGFVIAQLTLVFGFLMFVVLMGLRVLA